MSRKPLGIPLDELKRFAFALMELDSFLQLSGADRALTLCDDLRSEFDAHAFDEFADLPEQERFNIFYSADSHGFKLEWDSLDHALNAFPQIPRRLEQALPHSKVHKLAQSLQAELDKSSVLKKLRANRELLARSGIFS